MNIEEFAPGDVAGFSLAGYLQKDGTIKLMSGAILDEIPEEIELNNTIYTFEETIEGAINENGTFVNLAYV